VIQAAPLPQQQQQRGSRESAVPDRPATAPRMRSESRGKCRAAHCSGADLGKPSPYLSSSCVLAGGRAARQLGLAASAAGLLGRWG
jgi:hypothetical protein